MRDELKKLYNEKQQSFKDIMNAFPHDDLAGPFLMAPGELYGVQKNPLLIVGQETNGWSYYVDDIEKQMKTYDDFNVGQAQGSTAFWNIVRKVEEALGNDAHSCAWTNLSKFDLYGRRSYGKYEKAIAGLDKILVDEIKITAPKVCFFFTGPYFDCRLMQIYKGLEFVEIPGWSPKQFCQLRHPLLPEATFRSYHPKSLRLRSLERNFINYVASLSNVSVEI